MPRWLARLIALLAMLWLPPALARAQSCHEAEFHRALLKHDELGIEFQYKMQTGYIRRAKRGDITISQERNRPLHAGPREALSAIQSHLADIDAAGRTFALVYDPAPTGCVWLVGPRAFHRASSRTQDEAAARSRNALGVASAIAARSPRSPSEERAALSDAPAGLGVPNASQLSSLRADLIPEALIPHIMAARTLLVLPSNDLGAFPFALLEVDGKPLAERSRLIVLPGLDALFFWVKAAEPGTGSTVIVGDPELAGSSLSFAPLPGAREEARHVASLFGGAPLLGAAATIDSVERALGRGQPTLIYFATHGIADAANPMDASFLALGGQHLTGARIKRFHFAGVHPLVVMSACQTGLGKTFAGGIFGLARAWIYAGAAQVVTSHWNVDDRATADLMRRFMAGVHSREPVDAALQQAMIETRKHHPHPASWGAFTLFGYPQPIENGR